MTAKGPRRVAVIGGGITGLAAAFRLREAAAAIEVPVEVALFEASERVGGALETIRRDGFVIETGADSFLAEKPAGIGLAERLGLADQLVRTQERYRSTMVVRSGRLLPIPEGFSLIAPTYLAPVLRSPLFSVSGKLRILAEPLIPRRRADGDESVADFVARRLGREVLERVAQPLAAGIYTADPAQLSASATMPRFVEMERHYGSLIRGLRTAARQREGEARATSGARWSLFVSLRDGVGAMVDQLSQRLGESIQRQCGVDAIARESDSWRLRLSRDREFAADAVICTIPASAAATLLKPFDESLAGQLRSITYASAAVLNMAFRRRDFARLPSSFGLVVPAIEHRRIIAGSFSSLKFAHRAPDDTILMRAFLGGVLAREILTLDDDAMIAAAVAEVRDLVGIGSAPLFTHLRRWPGSMPQYAVGHRDRVRAIRTRAAALPYFELAGAYLDGVGIPDCIRQGEAAADEVIAALKAKEP